MAFPIVYHIPLCLLNYLLLFTLLWIPPSCTYSMFSLLLNDVKMLKANSTSRSGKYKGTLALDVPHSCSTCTQF
eukprot:5940930-Karenia_brevis.AAC.1